MAESLYIANTPERLIAKQNATSAASFSIPISKPQMAYIYISSASELKDATIARLAGEYLHASQFQVVANAKLKEVDSDNPILNDTVVIAGSFKLNISQKPKSSLPTESDSLYIANEVSRKVSRQRSVPASSYSLNVNNPKAYPYIYLLIIVSANNSIYDKPAFFQTQLASWNNGDDGQETPTPNPQIDTVALLGYLDTSDIDEFESISQYYDFTLTGTNRLTIKTNK